MNAAQKIELLEHLRMNEQPRAEETTTVPFFRTFRLRLVLAVSLFVLYLLADQNHWAFYGFTTDTILTFLADSFLTLRNPFAL